MVMWTKQHSAEVPKMHTRQTPGPTDASSTKSAAIQLEMRGPSHLVDGSEVGDMADFMACSTC